MIRCCTAFCLLLLAATIPAVEHPRLVFGADDVPRIREKAKDPVIKPMVDRLVADLEADDWGNPKSEKTDVAHPYYQTCVAERAAFLYVLTGEDRYAKLAREMVQQRLADGGTWANGGATGLRLYWIGSRVALVYDWCFGAPSWDDAFSKQVSTELVRHAIAILDKGGKSQNTSPASNWQGGRFASGGLCLLASDEPQDEKRLDQAYGRVATYLKANVGDGKDSRGWNIEGLGYNYFPMGNYVSPFAIAMQRRDAKRDLRQACVGATWTLWTCYAALVKTSHLGNIRPDFGDDNPGTNLEGTAGQAFWWCPAELHPGLVWWYDRTIGAQGDGRYDNSRCGTIWSILLHPGSAMAGVDPMTIPKWREGFVDTGGNGYMTWRNAYADVTDNCAQLYVKLRGNQGHSGPDALDFRIIGQDTGWAVGGGRYGSGNVYWQGMNNLYPGKPEGVTKPGGESGRIVGEPVQYADGGGQVVCKISENNVHVKNQQRWFVADFTKSGATACYVVGDTSDDGKVWQMNTYVKNEVMVDGRTFTITAPTGATMQGTVLYPADAKLAMGTRARGSGYFDANENKWISVEGDDGCFLVVLTVAAKGGQHPAPTLDGAWGKTPKGTVTVGGFSVTIEGDVVTAK